MHGDKFGTISPPGNGNAVVACASSPPGGFVADNTDCDDGDPNVHPGQTSWFDTASLGTHTFDYNCDNNLTKKYAEHPNGYCHYCGSPGSCQGGSSTTCGSNGQQSKIECTETTSGTFTSCNTPACSSGCFFLFCLGGTPSCPVATASQNCCSFYWTEGFEQTVMCGQPAYYHNCGTCGLAGQNPGDAQTWVKQACR
jgi:hypothetical protein